MPDTAPTPAAPTPDPTLSAKIAAFAITCRDMARFARERAAGAFRDVDREMAEVAGSPAVVGRMLLDRRHLEEAEATRDAEKWEARESTALAGSFLFVPADENDLEFATYFSTLLDECEAAGLRVSSPPPATPPAS